jgi:hypothetical protein
MTDRIADSDFVFEPPRDASKIEMQTDETNRDTTK